MWASGIRASRRRMRGAVGADSRRGAAGYGPRRAGRLPARGDGRAVRGAQGDLAQGAGNGGWRGAYPFGGWGRRAACRGDVRPRGRGARRPRGCAAGRDHGRPRRRRRPRRWAGEPAVGVGGRRGGTPFPGEPAARRRHLARRRRGGGSVLPGGRRQPHGRSRAASGRRPPGGGAPLVGAVDPGDGGWRHGGRRRSSAGGPRRSRHGTPTDRRRSGGRDHGRSRDGRRTGRRDVGGRAPRGRGRSGGDRAAAGRDAGLDGPVPPGSGGTGHPTGSGGDPHPLGGGMAGVAVRCPGCWTVPCPWTIPCRGCSTPGADAGRSRAVGRRRSEPEARGRRPRGRWGHGGRNGTPGGVAEVEPRGPGAGP